MIKYLIVSFLLLAPISANSAPTKNTKYEKIVAEWSNFLVKQRHAMNAVHRSQENKCAPTTKSVKQDENCRSLMLEAWGLGIKKADKKYSKVFKTFTKIKTL